MECSYPTRIVARVVFLDWTNDEERWLHGEVEGCALCPVVGQEVLRGRDARRAAAVDGQEGRARAIGGSIPKDELHGVITWRRSVTTQLHRAAHDCFVNGAGEVCMRKSRYKSVD